MSSVTLGNLTNKSLYNQKNVLSHNFGYFFISIIITLLSQNMSSLECYNQIYKENFFLIF